jgi:hypothetical protein
MRHRTIPEGRIEQTRNFINQAKITSFNSIIARFPYISHIRISSGILCKMLSDSAQNVTVLFTKSSPAFAGSCASFRHEERGRIAS